MKNDSILVFSAIIILSMGMGSCKSIKQTFTSKSAHQNYKEALLDSKLADKTMVREWINAADSALTQAVDANLPHKTTVTYFNDEPLAYSWRLNMEEGRILHARLSQSDTSHQVFMDLFSIEGNEFTRITSAEDSVLQYKSEDSDVVVLRLQPELLVSGSVTLTLTDQPSMKFPVAGASPANIQSFWGAPRDAGSRRHEGVDIFAERGTPVLATAEGRITRTGNGGLGGKTVWLRADGKSLYYAHLDSIIAHSLQKVRAGDTLGFVGNTGNARTTPPHLHFGIYDHGAINPLPFINDPKVNPAEIDIDQSLLGKWGRIKETKANIRPLPSTQKPPITSLEQNDALKILGATNSWYLIMLPDGRKGFVFRALLEAFEKSLRSISTSTGDSLSEDLSNQNPLFVFKASESLSLYANFKNHRLVKFNNHFVWLRPSEQP